MKIEVFMESLSINNQKKSLDIRPLHEGELPIFVHFLEAMVAGSDDQESWARLVNQFGRYRVLNK